MSDDLAARLTAKADLTYSYPVNDILLFREAAGEIERLRAGGCARDQATTQFCAEAIALQAENARLREALECIVWMVDTSADVQDIDDVARAALAEKEEK